jgi:hypothetical protein
MLLIIDPLSTLVQDLRTLPSGLARPLFLDAIRPLRYPTHTPEGAWEAYCEDRCLPAEARLIEAALVERFGPEPEFGRLVSLGLAHTGRRELVTRVLTAMDPEDEQGLLQTFWDIVARSQRMPVQLVSYGGARWGLPFLVRRSLLLGLSPSAPLPLGLARPERHLDLEAVLANWDRRHARPLELTAIQYAIPGPWDAADDPEGVDTAGAIRAAVARGERSVAEVLGEARLRAVVALHARLAESYLEGIA